MQWVEGTGITQLTKRPAGPREELGTRIGIFRGVAGLEYAKNVSNTQRSDS